MSNTVAVERELDDLDLEILAVLTREPLWKSKLHEVLDKKSVQTMGRRVDRLQKDGLLESCILSPEEIKRDLIIGFQTSDAGKEVLRKYHVCDAAECETLVVDGEDHIHEFVPAAEYFSAEL